MQKTIVMFIFLFETQTNLIISNVRQIGNTRVNYMSKNLCHINIKMIKKKIKVILLGESMTGKSSIAQRIVLKKYIKTESTIGAAYFCMDVGDIKYEIWDTAGQERYLGLTKNYYRGTDICLMVYDVINLASVDRLLFFLTKIINNNESKPVLFIVGNKIDLYTGHLTNIYKYVKNKLQEYDSGMFYIFVSAKTGRNIESLLDNIITAGIEIQKNAIELPMTVQLDINDKPKGKCEC